MRRHPDELPGVGRDQAAADQSHTEEAVQGDHDEPGRALSIAAHSRGGLEWFQSTYTEEFPEKSATPYVTIEYLHFYCVSGDKTLIYVSTYCCYTANGSRFIEMKKK